MLEISAWLPEQKKCSLVARQTTWRNNQRVLNGRHIQQLHQWTHITVGTNRTIGINGQSESPCTQPGNMRKLSESS